MRLKGLINYIISIGFALIFALYLSGRVGWFLILVMVSAPAISVLMTLPFFRSIRVDGEVKTQIIGKGEVCELKISIKNRCFLPSPVIVMDIFDSPRIVSDCKMLCVNAMPLSSESLSIGFNAKICGIADIGVKQIKIRDYLGLFSFKLKNTNIADLSGKVNIIPDVAELSPDDDIFAKIAELSALADDSEDSGEGEKAVFGGFPGYDSREYVPGDPLKRINWKLSAKRNHLLVRLDDEHPTLSVAVVADSVFLTELLTGDENVPLMEQEALENMLGIIKILVFSGYNVNCFVMGRNGWENYTVIDDADLIELRIRLASYSFSHKDNGERLPLDEIEGGRDKVMVISTAFEDEELKALLDGETGGKNRLNAVVYAAVKRDVV